MTTTAITTLTTIELERSETATAQDVALDWLYAKDIENAAKDAEKIRKAAGVLLEQMIGAGGEVTVNKGGFATFTLAVSDVKGRPSGERALDALVEAGKLTREDADAALEGSRGAGFQTIGLKRNKS